VHLLRLDTDLVVEHGAWPKSTHAGSVEHVVHCTGDWDAEAIRRQAAEAPMVQR
jgi:hypothetical protein